MFIHLKTDVCVVFLCTYQNIIHFISKLVTKLITTMSKKYTNNITIKKTEHIQKPKLGIMNRKTTK